MPEWSSVVCPFYIFRQTISPFYIVHEEEKGTTSPQNVGSLKCSHCQFGDRQSSHQYSLLLLQFFSAAQWWTPSPGRWVLSGWLEYLKSHLDAVRRAVPVRADCSLIYTVPKGSWDCVGSFFLISVSAVPSSFGIIQLRPGFRVEHKFALRWKWFALISFWIRL